MGQTMDELPQHACAGCEHSSTVAFEFCPKCGRQRVVDDGSSERADIRKFIAAFSIVAVYILSSGFFGLWDGYIAALGFDIAFFIIVLCTGYWFRDTLIPILSPMRIKLSKVGLYFLLQVLMTVFVVLIAETFAHVFGSQPNDLFEDYRDAPFPLAFAIVSIAVFPAITEELAFRGILFGQLRKLTSAASTIIVTGVLFALVHFSILSFVWLIPAGLFLGYVRSRYAIAQHVY